MAIGMALILAGAMWLTLSSSTAAQIERGGPDAQPTAASEATVELAPGATPTIDRLAAPPTVPSPNQADIGAQVYWHNCQPCHGDVGQGLTDEWRAQYPEEEQNCWQSGCHGKTPYELGHRLPESVPAVIGEGALAKFGTMAQVYNYMRVEMPYFYPGTLSDEEYLSLAAHLARENGIWDGQSLTANNLADYRLQPAASDIVQATPEGAAVPTPVPPPLSVNGYRLGVTELGILLFCVVAMVSLAGAILWLRRGRSI